MVSEDLRKKFGTIFMGGREASLEQIEAMQEPVFRERRQKEQEEDYVERVRKRAAERAKIILAEAYSERQKILEEVQAEAATQREQLARQAKADRAEAQSIRLQAEAELARASAIRGEAEEIRNHAHDEGFQAGMLQSEAELKQFRKELGEEVAGLIQGIAGQIEKIFGFWCDDLAELTRVAVSSATGWLLDTRHEALLRNLVLQAVSLLEKRESVTIYVNPADETLVRDMFKAAREKAPELRQWNVNSDESIEAGGLLAESASGSVDSRRENFKELVEGVLEHLSLPISEAEKEAVDTLHQQAQNSVRKILATFVHSDERSVLTRPIEDQAEEEEEQEEQKETQETEPQEEEQIAPPPPVQEQQEEQESPQELQQEVNKVESVKSSAEVAPIPEQPKGMLADLEEELFSGAEEVFKH